MKKILCVLLVCLPLFLFGQYPIQEKLPSRDTVVAIDNKFRIPDTINQIVTTKHERLDTVKVIMLFCDTATVPDIQFKQDVLWMLGYVVYEMRYGIVPCPGSGLFQTLQICYGWYKENLVEYLDSKKKLIKKSIVIWQTKEL